MRAGLDFAKFLDHFNTCLGCTGKRSLKRCRYAVECVVAETLCKKGYVKDAGELLRYGVKEG